MKPDGPAGHNVPAALTSLIGRTRELDGISETIRRTRLVTVTGPGGVGKTRLAIEVARRQVARRPDGVWLVDLTATRSDGDPAAEVARSLEVGGRSESSPVDSLCRYLVDRDMLLVIDNCEHVVEGCARLVASLLGACARVRVLATSRESLGVSGETVWRLGPLDAQDASRLFVERVRQRQPSFVADGATDATIAAVCKRLDDLPLAIELAAARITVMSPAEILTHLEARLGTLGGGPRLSPARQRTVRATVEWSYALLDPDEQRGIRSMAVFRGGFDVDAAMAVAPGLTVDVVARLVDKSVVVADGAVQGRTRYRLLETVREYVHELLVEAGELDAFRESHLRHFCSVAGDTDSGWPPFVDTRLLNAVWQDYENIRAALEWSTQSDPCAGVRLFAASRDLFHMLGQADGRRIVQILLERCGARDRGRVEALISAGLLAMVMASAPASRAFHTEALELSSELGERGLEGFAAFYRGLTQTLDRDVEPARADLEAARTLHQASGNRPGEGLAVATLGLTFLVTGELARARDLLEEALTIHREVGYLWGEAHASFYLGLTLDEADPDAARLHYRRAVDCFQPYRDTNLLPNALIGLAGLMWRREPATALRVTAAAYSVRHRVGGDFPALFRERLERLRSNCEGVLGADAARIWTEGTHLDIDVAIALVHGSRRPRLPAPAGLSAREIDVARLVADGLPNKTIAARLHVSVRTVESHVRHVLAKVGVSNRTQLAAWTREHFQ